MRTTVAFTDDGQEGTWRKLGYQRREIFSMEGLLLQLVVELARVMLLQRCKFYGRIVNHRYTAGVNR